MKMFYYLPFMVGILLYLFLGIISSFSSINTLVWVALSVLFLTGFLLKKGYWWTCVFGLFVGGLLLYMGTQETGQIIKETIFGVMLCLYYLGCGYASYKRKNMDQFNK